MRPSIFILLISLLFACTSFTKTAFAQGQRISQFEKAGLCDLLIDKSGVYHAVFQQYPDKPSSSTFESEQWDINLATNQTDIIASIQQRGVKITGF